MANLLIEIGNTALKAAWTEGQTLRKTYRYQGEKNMRFILSLTAKERPEILTIATSGTVTPEEENILKAECTNLFILDSVHKSSLRRYGFPEYLSYDRVASLVAARYQFAGKPCSVFDFGTTLTSDFMDADGKYLGGNISLGCRTRFKALNRYSRNLPLVNTPENILTEGNDEKSSVESGVISGIMFEIEGYISRRPENIVVFTGGDAVYFANKLKTSIFVVSNLVMMGLMSMTEDYEQTILS